MTTRWKIYGMQREWPNGEGSASVRDYRFVVGERSVKPWVLICCDSHCYRTRRQAMAAADKHIKEKHR